MLLTLFLSLSLAGAAVTGVVKDTSGGTVPGASVTVRTSSGEEQQTVTGPDGRFRFDNTPDGEVTLTVRAGGFAVTEQPIAGSADVEIVLSPATILEAVTVTPTRTEQRLGDVPASVSVLDREQIRQSPAFVSDDVLRKIPTFSLFRRTSSLSSHPTAQGVSLRGIGPSGVSRTLVLLDDIPFNDPFGGWVYWTRVPLENVERIEVVEGPSSSLYGNYAMGGVINIISSRPERRTVEFKPQFGNRNSRKAEFFASDVWGNLGLSVDGSGFDTDGFPIVVASERGRVDNNATVNFASVNVKADYAISNRASAFFRTGYFRENRDNGKASTIDGTEEANSTRWKTMAGGVRIQLPDRSDLQARLFTDFVTLRSNFLAVPAANPPRSVGRMTLDQRNPSKSHGGMVQWARAFGSRQFFSAGTDWRWVDGDSEEDGLDAVRGTTITLRRVSGGTQRSLGAFVQDIITPVPELTITLSMRVDHWRNYDAHNFETSVPSGAPTAGNKPSLPDREDTVGSPRAAALYHVTDRVSVWGSLSSGFRAPTLKELYRLFRVGAILTLPNENLGPERLVGGEVGVNLAVTDDLTVRTTWFDNRVKNPVSNVTIAVNTVQPQNLGKTRIRGLQTNADYRLGSSWRVSTGYLYNQATVREFAVNPLLVGKFLPQVPAHRASIHLAYSDPRYIMVAVGGQFIARQFDDDLNSRGVPGRTDLGLPKFAVWDLTASRAIGRNLEVFFGVQNLLDEEYFVGTLPTTIGSPRLVNGGMRLRFSGR